MTTCWASGFGHRSLLTPPCDLDHILDVPPSDKLYTMARKIISALLLMAMAVWAELTLAPFLSFHAHRQMVAMNHEGHHPKTAPAHPCCPKVPGAPVAPPPYAISSAGLPCANEHRCCFRHGPQSAPAPAGNPSRISKDLVAVSWVIVAPNAGQHDFSEIKASAELRSPSGDLNMVLRI